MVLRVCCSHAISLAIGQSESKAKHVGILDFQSEHVNRIDHLNALGSREGENGLVLADIAEKISHLSSDCCLLALKTFNQSFVEDDSI